ncbi:MAG: ABC transporter permease [Rhodobacteraceae bacterium]|nr:ABC transporter permease [Paracoccaceae bacterium]
MTEVSNSNTNDNYVVAYRPLRELLTGSVASITITLLIVIGVGLYLVGPKFLSFSNISIIGAFLVVPLIVGAFSGFALLSGVVDLSIGSMVAFSSALFALLLSTGWDPYVAGAITLICCIAFGGVNALAIVKFGASPIAATLGMLTALRGIAWVIVGDTGALFAFHPGLFGIVNLSVFGLPLFFLIAIGLTLIATLVVTKMRIGRHIQAVGGDERAAERAGISVGGVRTIALVMSALGAGIGGIIFVGQLGSASRATGFGLEFEVYAALMIGGYSILRGGIGNPAGGVLGLLAVAAVTNILDLTSSSPYIANIIVGLLLLAAVLLDRLRGGDAFE